jgi:imidazolonepropionase-like amidohydrolase
MHTIYHAGGTAALLFLTFNLAACGGEEPAGAPSQSPAVGKEQKYEWYLESVTPAGESVVVRTGDGKITNESFVHWNNREYRLHGETQLDEDGVIVAQTLTGTSAFGATIDESFTFENGVAAWKTPGESGSVRTDQAAFYVANEWAAVGSLEALVLAALRNVDKEIALFPTGSANIEKVAEETVETPAGERQLSLYAISGIGFTPNYAWFDEDMALAAISNSWLGMVPEGWNRDVLAEHSKIQIAAEAAHVEQVSAELTHEVETPVLIENVNIVDVESGQLVKGRHVLLDGGKIERISVSPLDVADALIIDGSGRYLLPGLWDMHGHFGIADGILNIAGGVTSVRDIGNEHEQVMALTAAFDSGDVIGPHTYRAGFIDRAGPYSAGSAAESLEAALEMVDFYHDNGYMQIKLYSSIEPAWVAPIADRTHEHGMRLSGHIPAFMSAEQAVRAGFDEIQHINMVFLNFLAGDREDTRKQLRFTLYGDEAGNLDLDSDAVQAFFDLLAENDVVVDATAAIFETQLIHKSGEPDPTFAAVVEHLPPSVSRGLYNPEMDMGGKADAWARSAEAQAAMLKALHEHGIQLVPGSDNTAAFTLHRELEVYAEAGIPNADVLKIATLGSAEVVGVDDRTGSIAEGKDADLILLTSNPLENVGAVRSATLVVKDGRLYRPDRLYEAVSVKPFVESEPLGPVGAAASRD